MSALVSADYRTPHEADTGDELVALGIDGNRDRKPRKMRDSLAPLRGALFKGRSQARCRNRKTDAGAKNLYARRNYNQAGEWFVVASRVGMAKSTSGIG